MILNLTKMKSKLFFLSLAIFVLVTVAVYFELIHSRESSQNEPMIPSVSLPDKFCDPIKLEAVKTQFCLDKRLIKNYRVKYDDLRKWEVNRANEVRVQIKTKDYSDSGPVSPGTSDWKNYKIYSGIDILFTVDLDPRFKSFDELAEDYSKPWTEPHNEIPPRHGSKIGEINNLKYVYELDTLDLEKEIDIDTHFFANGMQYNLGISASLRTINEKDFMLLHDTILKTVQFGID